LIPFINIHTHHSATTADVITISDWSTMVEKERSNLLFFSAGIHPWYIDTLQIDIQLNQLKIIAHQNNCKAIGECGIDKLQGPNMATQLDVFEKQIVIAMELKKPVIVHCVKAYQILFPLLKKYQSKVIFIIHGFNQNQQIAHQLLSLGAYLSFGKALINIKNIRLQEIFVNTPINRIFLENDDSTISIRQIFESAAALKKCNVNVMKEIIFANYNTVFSYE
jgi:TatD DNase family protein